MLNNVLKQQEDIQYITEQVLAKFPLLGVTMMSLPIVPNDKIGTAATDGHQIIYSPKFFSTLSDKEKQFCLAHEVMHVAFNHILRSKGRDQRLWDIATDSVINQILKNEKLPIIKGCVDIAEAVNHSAEEMYEKILKKKKQHDQEKQQKQEQQQSQSGDAQQPQDSSEQNQPNQEQSQDQPQDQDEQNQQGKSGQQSDSSKNQDKNNENSDATEQQKDQSKEGDSNSDESSSSEKGQENQSDSTSGQSSENQQGSPQGQKGQSSRSDSGSGSENTDWDDSNIDWDSEDEQVGHDTHDIWKKAVEQAERKEQQEQSKKKSWWDKLKEAFSQEETNENQEKKPQQNEIPSPKDEKMDAYEKGFLAENQEKRHELAEQIRKKLGQKKNEAINPDSHALGAVGETQTPVADWKKLLKRSFDEDRDRWSYRRSGAENDYMARVEELEDEGRPDTEVMLDVSGSVNIRLLREFLRQLKPLLKSSKLKVCCFDEFVYDFKEIKTKDDIDNFQITARSQWTENWDAAVRAFSNKKEVNKIVFTDGYPQPGTMPKEDLKEKNVIWLVYGNKDFKPCCGKVIQVSKRQMQSCLHTAPFFSSER